MQKLVFVVAMIAALLSFSVGQAQVSVEARFAPDQPVAVMAHRSADIGGMPENSLAWIEAAIGLGVDMVHINPQLTADGGYVLMHDHSLNRTTNVKDVFPNGPPNGPSRSQRGGKDYVRDYTLAEIRQLRLVGGDGATDYAVPTLQEALELVNGRVVVVLGLKGYEVESLADALVGVEKRNILLWQLYFSGTDQSKLRAALEATGLDAAVVLYRSRNHLGDLEKIAAQLGPKLKLVSVSTPKLAPDFLNRLEELGARLMVSGFAGREDSALVTKGDGTPWQEALHVGFAASTDHPALLLELLGR